MALKETFYKRDSSGALINNNDAEYKRIVDAREKAKQFAELKQLSMNLAERLKSVEQEMDSLKSFVAGLDK